MKGEAIYLEQSLKVGHFVGWQGRIYQVVQPDEAELEPLTIWLQDVSTGEVKDFRMETLLLCPGDQEVPIFAPTLGQVQEMQTAQVPSPPRYLKAVYPMRSASERTRSSGRWRR